MYRCSCIWSVDADFLHLFRSTPGRVKHGRIGLPECEVGSVLVLPYSLFLFCFCLFWEVSSPLLCWLVSVTFMKHRACDASLSWCLYESGAESWCWVHWTIWSRTIGSTLLWAVLCDCTGNRYRSGWFVPCDCRPCYRHYYQFYLCSRQSYASDLELAAHYLDIPNLALHLHLFLLLQAGNG